MDNSSIWRLPEVSQAARMSVRGLPAIPTSPLRPDTPPSSIARDFWIPQVSGDGQIYYANTVTGQLSRDLPFDTEDETFDCDLAGLTSSQSSSRAGTGAGLGFASYGDVDTVNDPSQSQLNPVEPARPPNASSSHYPNNLNGALTAPAKSSPSILAALPPGRTRAQTDSSTLPPNRHTYRIHSGLSGSPTNQVLKRSFTTRESSFTSVQMSLSSMDQDPCLFSYSHRPHVARQGSRSHEIATLPILPQVQELPPDEDPSHLLTAVPSLEEVLSPRPPELISELLDRSQQAIRSVITHLQQFGIPRIADDEVIVDNLINAAIASVRDLLYVSGPSFGQIPSHLVPKGLQDQQSTSTASHTLLVPAQRRAIATLSKFLLSARAILNDGPWRASDSIGNLATDATELERSVVDFVSITQSCRSNELDCDKGPKHLQGYFSAPHAGLGKAGAGAAGAWKGFGWVTIDGNEEAPRRSLDNTVLNDIVGLVLQVQDKSNEFIEGLRASTPANEVMPAGLQMINQLSSLLHHLGDLHIARHVDIEPVDQEELNDGAQYLRTVEKARVLVRSFEATTQAVYDDGAALLTTTQRIRHVEECETWRGRDEHYDTLEALNSSLDFNLQVLRQTLESLLVIVQEQTDILERSNKSPIEWRMSQRSLITAILAEEALNGTNNDLYDTNNHEADDILRNVASIEDTTPIAETPAPPVINGKLPLISDTMPWADYEDLRIIRTPPRQDKIRAFFGDDAPSHYLITLNAETKPWYLRPTYDPNDVLVDPDGTTRGGTVAGLVERLTAHEYADPKFSKAFLMTYKTFTTLDELFRLLVERFWIQPPEGLNSPELVEWRKLKQQIIRIRVINTIKSMVQDDDVLERDDAYILDRMMEFVSHDEVIALPAAKQLMVIIKRAQRGRDPNKVTISTALDPPPPPIVPKRMELLDIDALELARQLTITESQLYQKIRPSECLLRSKESKTDHHDNIANFIRRSNRVANWVAYAILCKDEPRRRASIMKHFISVADRCRHIQNFSTMFAIVSGLNLSPIGRLKRSWEQVGTRYMSQLQACETTISSYKTFNIYRHALAKVSPPCVPFVGVFLTALTHIQDGSKDTLPNNLVNFRKRQKASEVIQDLQRWQAQPHNFHPLPTVLVYLDDALGQFGDKDVSDVFWKLSLEREPREKEEEKLARMLHESGFF